ncbi:hypothetical protein SAMN05443633_104183 [Chryseobacterium arachidis]|uniref:Uncharacterized protein n=1 Tax=Chryseobacterium arachidis TaxID=1416778 RepID=A0A1M5BJ50_9FLAO|nr:hypothetical protein [Chryseobacterium arachidis]SHF42360.1 hypothetical protein SAMN05443633_104183 [Chryseobacterium arachidis]
MIQKIKFLFFFLLFPAYYFSQDGSDISYVKINEIDKNLIGKFIHLDFYHRSFGRNSNQDHVNLSVNKQQVQFLEIRKDTGHNNWFSEQSLLSVSKIKGEKLQIEKFQITGFDDKNLYVTAFINYLKRNRIVNKAQENMAIEKSKVVEILVEQD